MSAVQQRDVFICFSKSRPGEAKVALALKDQLEQHGLFAFEYEDWSWVAAGLSDQEVDVDRRTLRAMLTTCSVVVLISPHEGEASAGDELVARRSQRAEAERGATAGELKLNGRDGQVLQCHLRCKSLWIFRTTSRRRSRGSGTTFRGRRSKRLQ